MYEAVPAMWHFCIAIRLDWPNEDRKKKKAPNILRIMCAAVKKVTKPPAAYFRRCHHLTFLSVVQIR